MFGSCFQPLGSSYWLPWGVIVRWVHQKNSFLGSETVVYAIFLQDPRLMSLHGDFWAVNDAKCNECSVPILLRNDAFMTIYCCNTQCWVWREGAHSGLVYCNPVPCRHRMPSAKCRVFWLLNRRKWRSDVFPIRWVVSTCRNCTCWPLTEWGDNYFLLSWYRYRPPPLIPSYNVCFIDSLDKNYSPRLENQLPCANVQYPADDRRPTNN